ncbi:mucoidy inhibitor MuiA family protein [Saccharicrinis aurantiacus]|uniref:mucoidy inhibitor MuiA family protein n=1 Tax=Saccharicrinis aurantiacus TaxID=1849719 RepID=UPI002491EC60|nr:mucoidy inhibitor MuiA family protein [Saccharicrinis aurantiacus]
MNKLLLIASALVLILTNSSAQSKQEISSKIKQVTVFTRGAQIEREASCNIESGKSEITLIGLSPYIKKESIQIKSDGSFTILNVQQTTDFINELDKQEHINELRNEINAIQLKIDEENLGINIINEKLSFLTNNKKIITEGIVISAQSFESLNNIYGSKYESLSIEKFKKQQQIKEYQKSKAKLQNQMNGAYNTKDIPSGIITIIINSPSNKKATIKFNYMVTKATWSPSYDVRFNGTNKLLKVNYKANIVQNTGIDWENVKLTLSNAKTNISAQIPSIKPNYVNFLQPPPPPPAVTGVLNIVDDAVEFDEDLEIEFDMSLEEEEVAHALQGRVPGVQIRGTSSLKNSDPLYIVDGVAQGKNPNISADRIASIDVLKDASATALYGSRATNGVVVITTKAANDKSSVPLTTQSHSETTINYTIDSPQNISSNNEATTIAYKESAVDALFEYQTSPKLIESVYLVAKIPEWYKANFLSGGANVYLEDAYVGKSYLNTKQFTDTLDISFGIDNNINIKREKLIEFYEQKLIGSNKKETFASKITVRNNKPYPIETIVNDQIPVSKDKSIVIETLNISNASIEQETGILQWTIKLEPNESKELIIKYSIKYPKDKTITRRY